MATVSNSFALTLVIAYFLAPLPTMICGNMDGGGISFDGTESRGWKGNWIKP